MAYSLAYLSLITFFFLLLINFSSHPIHARELKSFNKALHNDQFPSETVTKPEESSTPQPENLPPQSQNGYGLYGRGPEEYLPNNERSGRGLPRTEFPDSREANAFYNDQHEERQKQNKETYGMSDTRSVENGKYFYDLNDQRHGDAYDPARGTDSDQGYGVMKDNGRFGYGVYNYEGRDRKGYNGYNRPEVEGKQSYDQNQGINQDQEYYDP